MSKASLRILAVIVSGGLSIVLLKGYWWWTSYGPSPLGQVPTTSPALDSFVIEMLTQKRRDELNRRRRNPGGHPSLDAILPRSVLDRRYPVQYAEEKLISRGSIVVNPLIQIMSDASQPETVRSDAALALRYFDSPQVTRAFAAALREGLVEPWFVELAYDHYLPAPPPGDWFQNPQNWSAVKVQLIRWTEEFGAQDYAGARLELLDRVFSESADKAGEQLNAEVLLRWFNRMYDVDLDEWLAKVAPDALRFRNEQLRKGYDPALVFVSLTGYTIDEAGIASVFSTEADRIACKQLLEIIYCGYLSRVQELQVPASPGWPGRVRSWYRRNREQFTYDFALHRFVVGNPTSRAASTPAR